jgi:hypothetical protein
MSSFLHASVTDAGVCSIPQTINSSEC